MRKHFTRSYKLSFLILCLSFSLGAGQFPSVSGLMVPPAAEPSQRKGVEESGEGLFERMVIDKITSLESSIKELTQKVENIEKRLSRIEKGLTARPASPLQPLTSSEGGTLAPQEPPKKRLKSSVPKEKDIGEGLRVINVDYHGTGEKGDNTFFKAEIENNTTDDVADALFKIEVYGEQGNLLGIESFELKEIKRAWPKKFTLIIYRVDADLMVNYEIKRLK